VFSCSDDTSEQNDENDSATISATINGVNRDFNFGANATLLETIAPSFFFFINASDDPLDSEYRSIYISIYENDDFAVFQSGTQWDSNQDEGVDVTYREIIGETDITASTDEEGQVFVKITFIDKAERLISGEFNGIVYDALYDMYFEIENGVFTNIPY
jgi:hypothetical protein